MDVRSLGFRTDLALLALAGSEVEDRGGHLVVRSPANPDHYWGNFLLLGDRPAPGGEQEVLATFDWEFPQAPHYAIGIDGTEDRAEQAAGFAALDLEVSSSAVMTATELQDPPHPNPDAVVRPLDSEEDWAQRVELLKTVNAGESPLTLDGFARGRAAQERALVAGGHGRRYGAFVGDRLLSTAAVFAAGGGLARFQSVETHPDARRRGLAGMTVHAAARHALDALGATTLVIVAEPQEAAIRVYTDLGFQTVEHQLEAQLAP